MEITNSEGNVYKFRGSLCADFEVSGIDLSDMVRDCYTATGTNRYQPNVQPGFYLVMRNDY